MEKLESKEQRFLSNDAITLMSMLPEGLADTYQKKAFEVFGRTKKEIASNELLEALQNLLHLHSCEMEGLAFPSKEQWFEAVKKGEEAIQKAIG